MSTFAGRPSTMSRPTPVEFLKNSMTAKTANVGAALRQMPSSTIILVWKMRFACSDFPSEAMLWINEVEMVLPLL